MRCCHQRDKVMPDRLGMRVVTLTFCAMLSLAPLPARAVDAPYDASLLRLAEILGSLHFLRNLCGETGADWRGRMERLIAAENPDEQRKAQMIAGFNRGYRSFQASYTGCTSSAIEAIARYTREGEAISTAVASRYGN